MKSFKKILCGMVLAGCASLNAHADVIQNAFFVTPAFDDGTSQSFDFSADSMTNADAKVGDSFIYDYLFAPAGPAVTFDFSAMADSGSVQFTGVSIFGAADGSLPPFTSLVTDAAINGSGFLDSGTYVLELTGKFLSDAGSFTASGVGALADPVIDAVPEPMSLALMGVGVAGLIGTRRRRGAAKAA